MEETYISKGHAYDPLIFLGERALGLISRQVCDDVGLRQLLNVDPLPTRAVYPLSEKLPPGDIFRFEGYM